MGHFRFDCPVDEDRLKRHDLSDAEWARLEPLLPGHPRQGHRWNDHRLVIDGIFFRTRTGCPWRGLAGAGPALENPVLTGAAPGRWRRAVGDDRPRMCPGR